MRSISFILALLFLAASVRAQAPADGQPQPTPLAVGPDPMHQAFAAIEGVLADAQSIEFQIVTHGVITEVGMAYRHKYEPQRNNPPGLEDTTTFEARGDKYHAAMELVSSEGKVELSEDDAWDGRFYQQWHHHPGHSFMNLGRACPDNNHLIIGSYNPLNLFGFLMPTVPAQGYTIAWTTVKNPGAWRATEWQAKLVGLKMYRNKLCVEVSIPGGTDKIWKKPCVYTVDFSVEDGFFPLAWQESMPDGWPLSDFFVDEFATAPVGKRVFHYPKKMTAHLYLPPDQGFPRGKPDTIFTAETTLLRFNTLEDDARFTIDWGLPYEVVDFDRQTVVHVNEAMRPAEISYPENRPLLSH